MIPPLASHGAYPVVPVWRTGTGLGALIGWPVAQARFGFDGYASTIYAVGRAVRPTAWMCPPARRFRRRRELARFASS